MAVLEDMLDRRLRDTLDQMQNVFCHSTSWRGVPALKNPLDFWMYQQIIHEQKPDVILEIGVWKGGSVLALADLCRVESHGRVIGVDIELAQVHDCVRKDPLITLIAADAAERSQEVKAAIKSGESVLLIEDSNHDYASTKKILHSYCDLIAPGRSLVVEDTICQRGIGAGPSPGPWDAVHDFLIENNDFELDREREQFIITWNPSGYLKRKA